MKQQNITEAIQKLGFEASLHNDTKLTRVVQQIKQDLARFVTSDLCSLCLNLDDRSYVIVVTPSSTLITYANHRLGVVVTIASFPSNTHVIVDYPD